MMGSQKKGTVVCIGVLPPPVTGAGLATQRVFGCIEKQHRAVIVPFSVPPKANFLGKMLKRLQSMFRAVFALRKNARATLYVALPGGLSAIVLLPVMAMARLSKRRLYLHHHNYTYFGSWSLLYASLFRIAGRGATHIVLCDRMRARLRELYKHDKAVEVSNHAIIRIPSKAELADAVDDDWVIAHLSNLSAAKGLGRVLEAYEAVRSEVPNARLRLGGPAAGIEDELLIRRYMDSTGGVDWQGFVAQDALADFFRGVSLFMMPSKNEAQPLVVLEAASFGVPSVTFGVGCLDEVPSATVAHSTEDLVRAALERHRIGKPPHLAQDTEDLIRLSSERLDAVVRQMGCDC